MLLRALFPPGRIYIVMLILFAFFTGACAKKSGVRDESDKFIRVLAAYLNRVPGSHSSDSLRTTLLDSLCQEHDYALAQFQKRMTQLNQKPEDWGPVMERVHNLMMQLKMQQTARPDAVSPSEPATPKP